MSIEAADRAAHNVARALWDMEDAYNANATKFIEARRRLYAALPEYKAAMRRVASDASEPEIAPESSADPARVMGDD